MNEPENFQLNTNLTAAQEFLQDLWEKHMQGEFGSHDTEDILALSTGQKLEKIGQKRVS